jgi:hypothetical protein
MGVNLKSRLGGIGRFSMRVVVIAVAVTGLAGCSGGSSTSTSSTTTSTSAPLPTAAASKTEIEASYTTLFDLSNPAVPPKLAVVQDGTTLKAAFTAAIKSKLAKEAAGATVLSVKVEQGIACTNEVLPSPCAIVVYNIFSPSRKLLLAGSKGSAVYESGHWLVAKTTICSLLTLDNGDKAPAGC